MQRIGGAAVAFQRAHGLDLGQARLRRARVQPAQKFHHCRAIAQMRLAHALHLGLGLAGLGQAAGVIAPSHGEARLGQQGRDRKRRGGAIDPHGALQGLQGRGEAGQRMQGDLGPQMRERAFVKLGGIGKQRHASIIVQNRQAMQHRIARDIGAADVQKPAQAVGQGDHGGALA